MARADESYASNVFPVERPPPQDPGIMSRIAEWLQLQQQPRPAPAPRPTRPSVPVTISERDPVANWAKWRLSDPLLNPPPVATPPVGRFDTPENRAAWETQQQWAAKAFEGGGPIGLGAPGGLAGWVKIARDPRGLPTLFTAGPGPPRGKLPPGQVEAPAVFEGSLSGRPGGPLHVDWLGAAGPGEKGPGFAVGKPIMDEAANLAREGGYTGTRFTPLSSSGTQEGPRLEAAEGIGNAARMGRERRIASNEIAMGNAAVQRGGGYEIPFPETMPPKPPWYEPPPQVDPQYWVRSPEEAAQYHQELLAQSLAHRGRMRELRREGVDPLEARAQSQRELDARVSPPPAYAAQSQPPAAQRAAIDELHALVQQQYPSATLTYTQLSDLAQAYRNYYGHIPGHPDALRQFAVDRGIATPAQVDRMLGPAATESAPSAAYTMGAEHGSPAGQAARGNPPSPEPVPAMDVLNLMASYRRAFQGQHGRPPGSHDELRQWATDQGYTSPEVFDQIWQAVYFGGPVPRASGGTPPPAPPPPRPRTEAQQTASRESGVARREALEADRILNRQREARGWNVPALTPAQEALLRRVEERQGAGMARETEQETRRAMRQAGQGELFRGTQPTARARAREPMVEPTEQEAAAARVAVRRAARRESLNRAEQAGRERPPGIPLTEDQALEAERQALIARRGRAGWDEAQRQRAEGTWQADLEQPLPPRQSYEDITGGGGLRERMIQTNREQRGEPEVAAASRWDDPVVAGGIEDFRHYFGRDPRTPQEVLEHLDFLAQHQRYGPE